MRIMITLVLSLLGTVFAVAHAQAPPGPATPMAETAAPAPQQPTGCAPIKPTPRSPNASQGTTVGEALGDKLARSNGVLCPPAGVDPEMRAPTPDTGNTPVIPPPGSPGGNPNVQPK
jgi:hypothetical protein